MVAHEAFDALMNIMKGQNFLRRVSLLHLDRWLALPEGEVMLKNEAQLKFQRARRRALEQQPERPPPRVDTGAKAKAGIEAAALRAAKRVESSKQSIVERERRWCRSPRHQQVRWEAPVTLKEPSFVTGFSTKSQKVELSSSISCHLYLPPPSAVLGSSLVSLVPKGKGTNSRIPSLVQTPKMMKRANETRAVAASLSAPMIAHSLSTKRAQSASPKRSSSPVRKNLFNNPALSWSAIPRAASAKGTRPQSRADIDLWLKVVR